jgi:hypothetical protein
MHDRMTYGKTKKIPSLQEFELFCHGTVVGAV